MNESTKRKIANLSKKVQELEFLLKIEKKNFAAEKENHTKEIQRISSEIENYDKSIETSLNELNQKENNVYLTQKTRLNKIREDFEKVHLVKQEIETQIAQKNKNISASSFEENKTYDMLMMITEDADGDLYEIEKLKKENSQLILTVHKINNTYSEKYLPALYEDFTNTKTQIYTETKIKYLNKEKEYYTTKLSQLVALKEEFSDEMLSAQTEMIKTENEIKFLSTKDQSIEQLQESIREFTNEILNLEIITGLLYDFFGFGLVNADVIKSNQIDSLVSTLENLKKYYKLTYDKISNELSIKYKKIKNRLIKDASLMNRYQRYTEDVSVLEQLYKKVCDMIEALGRMKKNKIQKGEAQIIIQKNFEETFLGSVTSLIVTCSRKEDEGSLRTKLLLFYKKIKDELVLSKQKIANKTTIRGKVAKLEKDQEEVESKIKETQKNIEDIETQLFQLQNQMSTITTISNLSSSRKIKMNLLSLKREELENYLKINTDLFTSIMQEGNSSVTNNRISLTKESFVEYVIINHTKKKSFLGSLVEQIFSNSDIIKRLEDEVTLVKPLADPYRLKLTEQKEKVARLRKEQEILIEAEKELSESIEKNLKEIELKSSDDKSILTQENNIPFYINQIEYFNAKIESLKNKKFEKEKVFKEKEKLYKEKEERLQLELKDFKDGLEELIITNEGKSLPISVYKIISKTEGGSKRVETSKGFSREESIYSNIIALEGNQFYIFKRNISKGVLDIKNPCEFVPNKFGYVLRIFVFDLQRQKMLIKSKDGLSTERTISFEDFNSIMIPEQSKAIIKSHANEYQTNSLKEKKVYINLLLLLKEGNIDIITQNINQFNLLSKGINEIIRARKGSRKKN